MSHIYDVVICMHKADSTLKWCASNLLNFTVGCRQNRYMYTVTFGESLLCRRKASLLHKSVCVYICTVYTWEYIC